MLRLVELIDGLAVAEGKGLDSVSERLWPAVTSQPLVVAAARRRLQDHRMLLGLGRNLVTAAAETAFNADAQFVAERLNHDLGRLELNRKKAEAEQSKFELLLASTEANLIAATQDNNNNNNVHSESNDDDESPSDGCDDVIDLNQPEEE